MTTMTKVTRYDGVEVWINLALVTCLTWVDDGPRPGTRIVFDRENAVLVKETPAVICGS